DADGEASGLAEVRFDHRGTALLAADAVHRATRRLPRVVRRARPEGRLVRHDARVAPDLFRPARMTKQVRVVALLPHEDEMRGRHELQSHLKLVCRLLLQKKKSPTSSTRPRKAQTHGRRTSDHLA